MFAILEILESLDFVSNELEIISQIILNWFQNSYKKMNFGKCYLLAAGHKSWAKADLINIGM